MHIVNNSSTHGLIEWGKLNTGEGRTKENPTKTTRTINLTFALKFHSHSIGSYKTVFFVCFKTLKWALWILQVLVLIRCPINTGSVLPIQIQILWRCRDLWDNSSSICKLWTHFNSRWWTPNWTWRITTKHWSQSDTWMICSPLPKITVIDPQMLHSLLG